MDNNQTIPQPNPEVATLVNPASEPAKTSSKMMVIIVIIVLLIIAIGGGVFYWMSTQRSEEPTAAIEQPTATIETADLSSELEATQPTDLDSDFSEIDKDLQSL